MKRGGMIMKKNILIILVCLGFLIGTSNVFAWTTTFSGYLSDPSNSALVGSHLEFPLFGDDYDIAYNVAIHHLTIPLNGNVSFVSKGYAMGGIDPYFTLFHGNDLNATFVASNYDQAFSTGGDFTISPLLTAGEYIVAMSVFANMSFAENNPDLDPTLGDGFTGVGGPGYLGNYYYELEVTQREQPVPEPATILFTLIGLAGVIGLSKKSRQ
jgi:hypothetical protein